MDEHILGQTNETLERYKFNVHGQMCEGAIDAYVAALKIIQKTCNFCDCPKQSMPTLPHLKLFRKPAIYVIVCDVERQDRRRCPGQWSEEKTPTGAQPRPV